jgi:hypothetical protein
MKRKMLKLLTIAFVSIELVSCDSVSRQEYNIIKGENEQLKKEIDDLKYGPEKLLSKAKFYIEKSDFYKAKSELQILIDKHPTFVNISEAKQLLSIVENNIKEQLLADEAAKIEKLNADKQKLASATQKLRTKYDDVQGITWYYDKATTQYTNHNSLHLYMGKELSGKPWLRFTIQYASSNWLFIENYVIKTDKNSYTISPSNGEVKHDNASGDIWEWYDVAIDNKIYIIVKDIINSKTVKLRHNGKQYYKDRIISEKEKQGLQNVLDAYTALGGVENF